MMPTGEPLSPALARPGTLLSVLYQSRATLSADAFQASGAPKAFAARNRERGITGYLHLEDGVFYQYIEGTAEAVSVLWTAIQRDPRHRELTEISCNGLGVLRFPRWAMGYNPASGSLFDWTARSGLSLKGPQYPQILTAFLEYASAGGREAS